MIRNGVVRLDAVVESLRTCHRLEVLVPSMPLALVLDQVVFLLVRFGLELKMFWLRVAMAAIRAWWWWSARSARWGSTRWWAMRWWTRGWWSRAIRWRSARWMSTRWLWWKELTFEWPTCHR